MGKISVTTDSALRISLPGKGVDSTNMLDFVTHSGFDYPKMREDHVGIKSYTVPASVSPGVYNVLTINHGLGYKPCSICFLENVSGWGTIEFSILPFYEGFLQNRFEAYTTDTQFKIDLLFTDDGWGGFYTNWEGLKFNFKYQIWLND